MNENYDFCGWATKNDLRCSDGRVIRENAFADQDNTTVPIFWNHNHSDMSKCLGHALLKNVPGGVRAYGYFNDTENGKAGRELVKHRDITYLSIFANALTENQRGADRNVIHGTIREVSLVPAGANPGALIDTVIRHGQEMDDEMIIFSGEEIELQHSEIKEKEETELQHADDATKESKKDEKGDSEMPNEANNDNTNNNETIGDVFNTLSEKQKMAVYAIIGQLLNDEKNKAAEHSDEGGNEMHYNMFEDNGLNNNNNVLSHADEMEIIKDAKRTGSLREATLAHGIDNIDYLFPEAKNVTSTPEWIKRDTDWADNWMKSVGRSPFSRIKSMFADITEDDARAKGYIKGNLKVEEVFSLLKRSTTPQTIYKKQKIDRDDVIDITDFDVVAWIKGEMRIMLDEEIARACLIGDGRLLSDDDKINESNIRPVYNDADLYTIKYTANVDSAATEDDIAKAFIKACVKSRKGYKGSGNPTLYTTEDYLTDMLLVEDTTGRRIYKDQADLATTLRVSKIETVTPMENLTNEDGYPVMGIIVNPKDYRIGADKGGAVNMFEDFDIDYNAQKYLIETRCSGALVKPYSAITISLSTGTVSA